LADLGSENVGIFCGHFEYFNVSSEQNVMYAYFLMVWYIFLRFGMLYEEKSGNPGCHRGRQGLLRKGSDFLAGFGNQSGAEPGLPDFSRHNIPKRVKMYQITTM
jgi:hypothetical protein